VLKRRGGHGGRDTVTAVTAVDPADRPVNDDDSDVDVLAL
jgi:hypothetical protein